MKFENILSRLTYHIQTGYLSYSEISDIYDLLPQCRYQGKAFRVIINCEEKDFNCSDMKNLYWSKSMEGINFYLSIITRSHHKDTLKSYLIIESEVDAVDVNQVFDHLRTPDLDSRINPYGAEEELLAVTANSIRIISFNKV